MPRSQKPWGYFERDVKGQKIPILSITHLPNPYYAGWDGFLEKVKEIYATAPALIIDIRGNGGGSDQMPKEMARILYGLDEDSRVPYPESRIVRRQSPEALAVFLNNYGLRILVTRLNGTEPTPDLFKVYEEWNSRYQRALMGELPPEDIIEISKAFFDARKVFRGPIKILVDAECGSSCESTLEFFESHPSAESIGQRTGGYVHFGNLGRLWLRKSNLFVGIPTQQHVYLDGRFIEKMGYEPSIIVAPGTDALNVALEEVARHL
jgi:C-terminal processing protease CtpA/Prc